MYYFLVFNNLEIKSNYTVEIKDIINSYYGKIIEEVQFSNLNFSLIIKNENLRDDLPEFLTNFFVDNFLKSKVFKSQNYESLNCLKEEMTLKNNILLEITNNTEHFFINEKCLLEIYLKREVSNEIKKMVLKELYNDFEMIRTIKGFIECNLNSVLTSKYLNIHRNTLNYRLNKFLEVTGYDVKNIKDAFTINRILD